MILAKYKCAVEEYDVCIEIVGVFLKDFVRNSGISFGSGMDMSELLRYSLCKALDLDTKGALQDMDEFADKAINILKPTLNKYNLFKKNKHYKQQVLEACVHCMELSIQRAGV